MRSSRIPIIPRISSIPVSLLEDGRKCCSPLDLASDRYKRLYTQQAPVVKLMSIISAELNIELKMPATSVPHTEQAAHEA
jgi:hypothetical protein